MTTFTQHALSATTISTNQASESTTPVPEIPASTAQTSAVGAAEIIGVRAAWAVAQPGRPQYAEVVQAISSLKMVGEGSIFERGLHLSATHLTYFKPPWMLSTQN